MKTRARRIGGPGNAVNEPPRQSPSGRGACPPTPRRRILTVMVLAQEAHAIARGASGPRGHVIDVLIEERAPKLAASPAWPILRPPLYALLGYRKARAMADAIAAMPGRAALDFASELLSLEVATYGLERIPRGGRVV